MQTVYPIRTNGHALTTSGQADKIVPMAKTVRMTSADSRDHSQPSELLHAFDVLRSWLTSSLLTQRQLGHNAKAVSELESLVERGRLIISNQEALLTKLWNENQGLLVEIGKLKSHKPVRNSGVNRKTQKGSASPKPTVATKKSKGRMRVTK